MSWKTVLTTIVAVGTLCANAAELKLTDTLDTAANWKLDNNWSATDGQMIGNAKGSSFLLLKNQAVFSDVTLEADVTPLKATSTNWKVTGIGINLDNSHFWHLCLVESPDANDKKHNFELKSKVGKKWGAEHNLKGLVYRNSKTSWEYGKTYRMRLTLNAEKIEGVILDSDGKELLCVAFDLTGDAEAVTSGRPCLRNMGTETAFDNIAITAK
jgi:hypothetical protein